MSNVRSKNKPKRYSLPEHFETLDEAAEFWNCPNDVIESLLGTNKSVTA